MKIETMGVYGSVLYEGKGLHEFNNNSKSGLAESYFKLISLIVGREEGLIVDVGGGTGELAKRLADSGLRTLMVDRSLVAGMAGKSFVLVDACRLPLKSESVALIHCKDMIEHLDSFQLKSFLSESREVLDCDSRLIITTANYSDLVDPYTLVWVKDTSGLRENIVEEESYEQLVERMAEMHGGQVVVGMPYYPRTAEEIKILALNLGFSWEATYGWVPKLGEPDWFEGRVERRILVFRKV